MSKGGVDLTETLERQGISFIADPGGGIGVRLEKKPG
jgi:hypothetical protein